MSELAGGEGEVGEELEDIDGYPKVVLDGVGGDWTELAAVAVGAAAVPLRRGREGEVWPQSFTVAMRTRSGVQLGPRKGGEQGSTVELEQRRQWWGGGSWVRVSR